MLPGNHSASRDKNAPCVCLHTLDVYAGVCGRVNTGTCVHMLTRISSLCILILLLCSPHRGAGVLQPNSPLMAGLEFALLSAWVKKTEKNAQQTNKPKNHKKKKKKRGKKKGWGAGFAVRFYLPSEVAQGNELQVLLAAHPAERIAGKPRRG